ncbi:uncharacterized protein [Elaeis guineensis]|uniref:uncharacterized protein isoform X1 n=1 Tax=Elaeis guineensis var. tenera TaxID=51953 RepID=UPI003C6D2235
MAHRKEKPNLRGDPVSPGNRILRGPDEETTVKRPATPLPVPEVKPGVKSGAHKAPKLDGSSTETEELHIVDESDGRRWIIQDKTVIDLLRSYKSASDEKTKDDIVKRLQSYVASLSKKSNACQASKNSSDKGSSHQSPMSNAASLSKIIEKILNLKVDECPQVFMSSTKIQASQSDKQLQLSKNAGTKGDLDGNRMDVDKNSSPQRSMPRSVHLPRDGI